MTAKKTTKKKAAGKKAPAKAKAAGKKAPVKAKAAGKKAPARAKTAEKAGKQPAAKKAPAAGSAGKVTAAEVNLGHVFALRPRVEASFGPEHLRRAKDQLSAEAWASLPEAARAVAEKALEIAHEAPPGRRG